MSKGMGKEISRKAKKEEEGIKRWKREEDGSNGKRLTNGAPATLICQSTDVF